MSKLRERMIQDMQLRGLSPRTQVSYARAIQQLALHYHKTPDQITQEELRDYFLYRKNTCRWSASAATITLCAIKFFYENTLKKDFTVLKLVRPKRHKKLPVVLSVQEVRRTLRCVRLFHHRFCLTTVYSCGLRLKEAVHLQVPDIDSDRMFLHVHGKGNKDRYVPLPQRTLQLLRQVWKTHHNPRWIFPARAQSGSRQATCDTALSLSTIQKGFKDALSRARVNKIASVHTLRHSYATHLLEQGINIATLKELLGHADITTTMIYLHVAQCPVIKPHSPLDTLYNYPGNADKV